MILKGLDMGYP